MKRERSSPIDTMRTQSPSLLSMRGCHKCGLDILDKFVLEVSGNRWHVECLRCCMCKMSLDMQPTCYMKEHNIYCKNDYARLYGIRCSKCLVKLSPTDWVRKAREKVYHLACFVCDACQRQLSTGEEFSLHEERVLCKTHFLETVEGGTTSNDEFNRSIEATDGEGTQRKSKRVRTTFTDEQQHILQNHFRQDSNPDSQDLERIAMETGLTKRVTQVWFQNSRARQKKHMTSSKKLHHSAMDIPMHDVNRGPIGNLDVHFMYFRSQSVEPEDSSSPDTPLMHMMHSEV